MAETLDALLIEARRRLATADFGPSTREAALLLGRVLGLSEAQVLARSDQEVSSAEAARFRSLMDRRLTGEPVAYLLGEREFYGRSFAVDNRVLIPRPETEHLIETALALSLPEQPRVLDVGTGSGCIAVTLALELPRSEVVATDRSPAALAVAAANIRRLAKARRVACICTDLAGGLDLGSFDLVVSNPPYVDPAVRPELSSEVTGFEPAAALFASDSGSAVLAGLLGQLADLRAGTPIVLEIGYDQSAVVAGLAAANGLDLREIRPDLAGHPRVAVLEARS